MVCGNIGEIPDGTRAPDSQINVIGPHLVERAHGLVAHVALESLVRLERHRAMLLREEVCGKTDGAQCERPHVDRLVLIANNDFCAPTANIDKPRLLVAEMHTM